MIQRRLGRNGPPAGAVALGCMGLSEFYDPVPEAEAIATIHRALDLGMNLVDTSDMYGLGENERLVGRALRGRRDRALIATKGGLLRRADDPQWRGVDGRPDALRAACDASLERLGVDYVDLYYLHRDDPQVAIEESVGAMAELVAAGKVRALGLSQVSAETLARAARAAPIAVLQSEYSLFTRDVETTGVLDAARALGVTLVAYAPLGRGILTGSIRSTGEFGEGDLRRRVPRFDAGNFEPNLALVDAFAAIAAGLGYTPAQLAIAWTLARDDDVIALPGAQQVAHVVDNAGAGDITLDTAVVAKLDAMFPAGAARGERIR